MYGFEHDPDEDDADPPRSLIAEIAVLLVPAAIMIAGFAVAVSLLQDTTTASTAR